MRRTTMRRTTMRRAAAIQAGAVLALGAVAGAAMAAKPVAECPTAFELGAMTLEASIALKDTYGFPAEAVPFYAGLFASVDKNGNGLVCLKGLPDTPGIAPWVFQLADDVSNARG